MKKLSTLLFSLLLCNGLLAQNTDSLIFFERDHSDTYVGHLNTNTKAYRYTDTLNQFPLLSGLHCFDMLHQKMFVGALDAIYSFDVASGKYLDTFASSVNFHAIEYSLGSQSVIGLYSGIGGLEVYAVETSSKTTNYLNTIGSISQILDRPTYDLTMDEIYLPTNLGITKIDANTGLFKDSISNSRNLASLEYHPGHQLLYGVYWDGQNEIFCSLDPKTKTYTDIASLPGVNSISGTTSMDITSSRYIIETNLGLTFINLISGQISATINQPKTVAFEYINRFKQPNALPHQYQEVNTLYPNPSTHTIFVTGIEEGSTFHIWDNKGVLIMTGKLTESGINIELLPVGLYQIRFEEGKAIRFIRE